MSLFLEAGKVIALHSFKGEVKIKNFCDDAEFFMQFGKFYLDEKGEIPLTTKRVREANGVILATFEEINSEAEAEKIKNKTLYFRKEDAKLFEDSFFITDLIGLEVFHLETLTCYGKITDIFSNGKNDIFVIKPDNNDKKDILIPNVAQFVKKIEAKKGVFILPIEGMIEQD